MEVAGKEKGKHRKLVQQAKQAIYAHNKCTSPNAWVQAFRTLKGLMCLSYNEAVYLSAAGLGPIQAAPSTRFGAPSIPRSPRTDMFQTIRFFRAFPKKKHMTWGVLACALWTSAVHADDYTEVNRLMKAGQPAEALSKADQYLNSKPRDPQMRFLKGVILAETGKASEAIQTFVKLTEDYPELPEPYNNLAVLYASQSQFEKARVALEMAIRTNPSYATAHENLGDVYAKLASQSYSKALQLDGSNTGVPTKLALIRNLFAPDTRAIKTTAQSTVAVAPTRTTSVTPVAPAVSATPVASAPVTSAPPEKTIPAASAESPEITAAVQAWAKAWAGKDMNAYFAAYSSQFKPTDGKTRKAWEMDRQERILSKSSISVQVSDVEAQINGNKATASFRQAYRAGSLASNSRKTLEMTRENGKWLITRESTGG